MTTTRSASPTQPQAAGATDCHQGPANAGSPTPMTAATAATATTTPRQGGSDNGNDSSDNGNDNSNNDGSEGGDGGSDGGSEGGGGDGDDTTDGGGVQRQRGRASYNLVQRHEHADPRCQPANLCDLSIYGFHAGAGAGAVLLESTTVYHIQAYYHSLPQSTTVYHSLYHINPIIDCRPLQ
ncbi:hypothetical protein EDB85DRAFT_2278468 [Lactarius pseudohatsudake]|nr:hypothetical protein EDB85DRAFT_2278468 [Lactarius pseudohatsudake]